MRPSRLSVTYWTGTAACFAGAVAMLIVYTPVEPTMGPIQKMLYLHWPVAIDAFAACFVVFVASIGYLWQREERWDDLAVAASNVAAVYCAAVLVTGVLWARSVWGVWWIWSPRLTFSLVLFLLYVGYLALRPLVPAERRAVVSAGYGIAAFVDVPLVFLSVKLMPDVHPTSITLAPAMKLTLAVWFVPITLIMGGLIATQFGLNRRRHAVGGPGPVPVRPRETLA
ncbi:MAG: cytochrome c biogenesis protein CcsA [Phycisphaerales bacterium]|nr:cytochrome c biogenesis protein CcsA [Phycisphaerales bacterium]